jgi:hypothetical protein
MNKTGRQLEQNIGKYIAGEIFGITQFMIVHSVASTYHYNVNYKPTKKCKNHTMCNSFP